MVVATGAPIKKVIAAVQNYEWGLQGSSSLVAKLAEKNSGEKIDESKPYAELWMGTHPNAPCKVKTADGFKPLKEFLPSGMMYIVDSKYHGRFVIPIQGAFCGASIVDSSPSRHRAG